MPLFTVILDLKGGTYIEQLKAATPSFALRAWAEGLDPVPIKHFGPTRKKQLVAKIEWQLENGLSPVPLTGLKNAWCAGYCPGGGLINMVRTDQAE